jgi:cbb3-type cytochrome oxidase subunit 3
VAVAALTVGAVFGGIPFIGLAALLLLFGGGTWVALRRLRWEAMRFRAE